MSASWDGGDTLHQRCTISLHFPASVDPPLPTCVRDDSGCLATCTCPESDDVTIVFDALWSTPQCGS